MRKKKGICLFIKNKKRKKKKRNLSFSYKANKKGAKNNNNKGSSAVLACKLSNGTSHDQYVYLRTQGFSYSPDFLPKLIAVCISFCAILLHPILFLFDIRSKFLLQ